MKRETQKPRGGGLALGSASFPLWMALCCHTQIKQWPVLRLKEKQGTTMGKGTPNGSVVTAPQEEDVL